MLGHLKKLLPNSANTSSQRNPISSHSLLHCAEHPSPHTIAPRASNKSSLASCAAQPSNAGVVEAQAQEEPPLLRKRGSAEKKKGRLDEVCVSLAPHLSRNVMQSYILQVCNC